MLALILVVDFVLYYPFFRAYDAQKCAEEAEISQEELTAKNAEKAAKLNDAFQGKADAKSVAAGAAAEAVKADALAASAAPAAEATTASDLNGKRVLVLCQGGGTSGLLANALAKAAKERGINLETAAEAYGNHVDMLPDFDLVVLAPAGSQLPGRPAERLRACGQQVRRLPWQTVHRALPERRQVSRLRK